MPYVASDGETIIVLFLRNCVVLGVKSMP